MELMDLDRYASVSGVNNIQLNSEFEISEKYLQRLDEKKLGAYLKNFKNGTFENIKGKWVSVNTFKNIFSSYAIKSFGQGFKNKTLLVVRNSKGVQNPETFAQDVLAEVISKNAHYIPSAEASKDYNLPSVECVREQDIANILRNYEVVSQKDMSTPTIQPFKNGEQINPNAPQSNIKVEAHTFQNPSQDTSGLPFSRFELPKLKAWYFSGKTLPLANETQEMLFNKAIELFHEKWSQDPKNMSFDEWLEKILPNKIVAKKPQKQDENETTKSGPKKYYMLKSGDYVTENDFKRAILEYFKDIERSYTLRVVKKDEGVIDAEQLVDKIVSALKPSSKVTISPTISQKKETPTLSEVFPQTKQLPCGKNINLQDVINAMQNYIIIEKKKEIDLPVPPKPVPPKPVPPQPIPPEPTKTESTQTETENENFFDEFFEWLNGISSGTKKFVKPGLMEKFKIALEKLQLQWNEENKREPKKPHKSFEEWLKDWIKKYRSTGKSKKTEEIKPTNYENDDPSKKDPIDKGSKENNPTEKIPTEEESTKKDPKEKDPTEKISTEEYLTEKNPTEKNQQLIRVTRKLHLQKWVAATFILASLLPIAAGFELTTIETPTTTTTKITEQQDVLDHQNMNYSLNVISQIETEIQPTTEEIMSYIESEIEKGGNITLGNYNQVSNGQAYHLRASTKSNSVNFGDKGAHPAGQYRVTGLAISDGKNIAYIEDFNAQDSETSLKKIAQEAQNKGIDWSKAQVFWHAGSKQSPIVNADGTQGLNCRAGWILAEGYSFENMPTSTQQFSIIKTPATGTIENFTGTNVTVNGKSFKVVDEKGNALKPGSYVAEDGTLYEINEVKLEDVYSKEDVTKTTTTTNVTTSRKLTYNLGFINFIGVGLAAGLFAALEATRRKINKRLKDNPQFNAFGDAVSFEEFRVDFEQSAKEMKKTINEKDVNEAYKTYLLETQGYIDWASSINKTSIVSKIYNMKSYYVELTDIDKKLIEEITIQTAQKTDNLGFNPETDNITIQGSHKNKYGNLDGRMQILINYNEKIPKDTENVNRRTIDVTEKVMGQIKKIGQKNPIKGIDPDSLKKLAIIQKNESGSQLGQEE